MSQEDNLLEIHKLIRWLDDKNNSRGQSISDLCLCLDKLAIRSFYLASDVSEADTGTNNAKDSYDSAVASYVANATVAAAKAERQAEVEFAPLRREFVSNKNLYNKLRLLMSRIDAVLDSHKQYVSFLKQEQKHQPDVT